MFRIQEQRVHPAKGKVNEACVDSPRDKLKVNGLGWKKIVLRPAQHERGKMY